MIEVARIYRVDNGSGLKAFADVVFENTLLVRSIRIISNRDGELFVRMPRQQGRNGRWYKIVSIVTDDARQELQEALTDAYYV